MQFHLRPDLNNHAFGHCVNFSGKKITTSLSYDGARTPMNGAHSFSGKQRSRVYLRTLELIGCHRGLQIQENHLQTLQKKTNI